MVVAPKRQKSKQVGGGWEGVERSRLEGGGTVCLCWGGENWRLRGCVGELGGEEEAREGPSAEG